jgi:hypothetical protein
MELRQKITLLEEAVSSERSEIRVNYINSFVVFIAGLIGAIVVHKLAPAEMGTAKLALTICTGFSSLFSGLPIKDVATKRVKIAALSYLKNEYEYFQEHATAIDEQRISETEKRFWKFFDKNLTL